jgi:hypothetical protein
MRRLATDIPQETLRRAWEIHESGASWLAVADAVCINHDTLCKALRAAGYNTARRVNGNGHYQPPPTEPPAPDTTTLLHRIRAAANDPPPDAPRWCSEPRFYPPGCPEAAGLRAVWGVPVGGRRRIRQPAAVGAAAGRILLKKKVTNDHNNRTR